MAKRKAKDGESTVTANVSSRRRRTQVVSQELTPTSIRLEYDPVDPTFTPLHRAGIAGLLLQIKAMRKLHEQAPERYVTPKCGYLHGGRGLWVEFDENSFHAVMRERYQAIMVEHVYDKPKEDQGRKKKAKDGEKPRKEKPKRYKFIKKEMQGDKAKYFYLEPEPYLQHCDAFGVQPVWQRHFRRTCFASFFCIPQERPIFESYSVADKAKKSEELWKSIVNESEVELGKSLYPNSFKTDLEGIRLRDAGRRALMLHFWSLASAFYTPRTIKFDRDKERFIPEDHQPVIVVPDVCHVRNFADEFTSNYLLELPAPIITQSGKEFLPDAYISTPREASLTMFAAPRVARTLTSYIGGARGAVVYVYRKPLKKGKPDPKRQAEVVAVISEALEDWMLDSYKLLHSIQSFPYRALRIENLLTRRIWHDGFERITTQFPLELFVATKRESGEREHLLQAKQMAQSLREDFNYYARKENRMSDEETNVPTLIHDLVGNYIRKRPYNKGQERISEEQLNKLFEKKREKKDLNEDEKKLLNKYNQARLEGVEREFIDFRGRRDPQGFGNLFVERFFAVPYHITPEQIELLQPYYEGDRWEIGRRLVLMSISSAGAPPKRKATRPNAGALSEPKATNNVVLDSMDDEGADDFDDGNSEEEED